MREEMAHISNNMIIMTLHLPESIKTPVKEALEFFFPLGLKLFYLTFINENLSKDHLGQDESFFTLGTLESIHSFILLLALNN